MHDEFDFCLSHGMPDDGEMKRVNKSVGRCFCRTVGLLVLLALLGMQSNGGLVGSMRLSCGNATGRQVLGNSAMDSVRCRSGCTTVCWSRTTAAFGRGGQIDTAHLAMELSQTEIKRFPSRLVQAFVRRLLVASTRSPSRRMARCGLGEKTIRGNSVTGRR